MNNDEVNDEVVVVNDLLSFVHCKIGENTTETLIECLQEFYPSSEALEAYRTLYKSLPHGKYNKRRDKYVNHNPYLAILQFLQDIDKNDLPLFVCKDLDNIPKTRSSKQGILQKRIQFIEEHKAIKNQINDLYRCLYQMRKQFLLLHKKTFVITKGIKTVKADLSDPTEVPFEFGSTVKKDFKYLQKLVDEDSITNEETVLNFMDVDDMSICDDEGKESRPQDYTHTMNGHVSDSETAMTMICEEQLGDEEENSCDYFIIEQILHENIGFLTLFKCSKCSFTSNEEKMLIEHKCVLKKYAKETYTRRSKVMRELKCSICSATFTKGSELRRHRKREHRNEKMKYPCPLCSETYREEDWQEHVRTCLGNTETKFKHEDIHCELCDVFFGDEQLLKNHRAFHDLSRPFECRECKFRFYSQKRVEEHFKVHRMAHSEGAMKCPFCPRRIFTSPKLEEHIRVHTGDRPFKCLMCNFTAMRQAGLQSHLSVHSKRKDYQCHICGRSFKVKSKLLVHRKVHSSHRPFKCPECGKGFKTGREMSTHHRNHLGIRNYPCPYCDYKAVNASVLRGHINVHFNKKPFKCSFCGFGCNHKSYLNLHIKNVHGNVTLLKSK